MSALVPQRVLLVGSGSIAQRHARNLLELGVAEVVVVTARDVSGVEAFADPRVRVVPAIPADCPKLAIVANATGRHLETAEELVSRGAHMLIEKPVAAEPSERLDALCASVSREGLVARVAYNLRMLPALTEVHRLLADSAVGRPLFARIEVGQWLPDWRPGRPVEELYSAKAGQGGGVALDLSHEVDYMTMLFGFPERWRVMTSRTGVLPIDSEDVFDAIYQYESGFSATVHLDYLERLVRRRLRVVCSAGVIECDMIAGRLSITGPDETHVLETPSLFDRERTYVDELTAFFSAVAAATGGGADTSGDLLPTLDAGRDLLALLDDRVLEPAERGRA